MGGKLVLIDGHSILNRAFFGIPDLTNSEGLHTNAVYGFLNILFKILEEERPDYLTVAFDVHQPTFRHEMYAEYKGTRKPMAEELREQVPLIKEMLTAMGVTIIEQGGYLDGRSRSAVKKRASRSPSCPGTGICCSWRRITSASGFRRRKRRGPRSRITIQKR